MLILALLLAGSVYGSGAPATAVVRPVGDRDTLPLVSTETLVFLGFNGDFGAEAEVKFHEFAIQELSLNFVGSPLRSTADKAQLVWAVRTDNPSGLAQKIAKPLKEKGYTVTALRTTAFSILGGQAAAEVQRGMRELDRVEKKVWGFFQDNKEGLLWVFHEPKLAAEKLMGEIRDAKVKAGFYHQELELEAKEGVDAKALADQACQKLDLARASNREQFLVLDVYLRDVDGFLALNRGKRTVACPDVLKFLQEVPAGNLSWVVTLENRGYPFVN